MNVQNKQELTTIISVEQAHNLLQTGQIDDGEIMTLCDAICTSDSIVGSSADYHNLAVELTRKGCFLHGFNIVTKGLKLYPFNIDLLADAVYYGSSAGKFDECEQYAQKLQKRPFALWNWRAYTFLIDYYMDKADWTESEVEVINSMKRALELAQNAQKILGNEEQGYLAEHRVHEVLERWYRESAEKYTDEAEKYLQLADAEKVWAVDALNRAIDNNRIVAVQCCMKYADLKFEEREYEETIRVCEKAFCYGESQPSAKMGYFLYLAAMSMDALIHENKAFGDSERVKECYRMYQAADKTLDSNRSIYRSNIKLRVKNLEARSGVSSGFQNTDGENSTDMLRQLLGSLEQCENE